MRFLNRERLTIYPRIFLALYLVLGGYWIMGGLVTGKGPTDRLGKPVGGDFVTYWAASRLALSGKAAAVYDSNYLYEAERQVTGVFSPQPWHYPPTFLLMVLPVSLFPFLASLVIWLGSTLTGYLTVIRRIAPHTLTFWLTLAFPGTFQNLIHGQNGFLSAGLLGAGLLLIDRKPLLAGLLFGLLTFKPHLAVLLPVALVAGRYWKTLAAMILSGAVLAVSSALILGTQAWVAFWKNIPFAMRLLTDGSLPIYKMPSVFAAILLAGGSPRLAQFLQALISCGMVVGVAWIWVQKKPLPLRASILTLAILLTTPFAFEYDLTILALPLAWLGGEVLVTGWLPLEQPVMAATWLLPLVAPFLARLTHFQLSPLVLLILVALLLRRAAVFPASLNHAHKQ
jgi:hypothetical protein